jgi:uncharacterized protein YndB with AHSA1/START domain
MKWLLIITAILIAIPLILWIIGFFMPRDHVVSRTLKLKQPVDAVWAVISDYDRHAEWQSGYTDVKRLPDRNGKPIYSMNAGGMKMTLELTEIAPPSKLISTIADDTLPFGGTWTWELAPTNEGCTLTITERGFVKPALFRVIGGLFIGHDATINKTLRDLAKKFGEEPRLS